MKAQVSIMDMIISISIFIVIAAFLLFYWNNATTRFSEDVDYQDLQIRANRIADQLIKTPGDPTRWEVIPNPEINNIHSLGLAVNDRVLSEHKLFNLTRIPYDDIKKLLNIEPYDFNITVKVNDDIITLLKKYDIRVAYVQIGLKCTDTSLRKQLEGFFSCKEANTITNRNEERCEMYVSTAMLNNPDGAGTAFAANFNIFENLSEYDLVVMEDPRLDMDPSSTSANEPTYPHSQKIINFTKKGGFSFFTMRLATASNYLLGVDWIESIANINNLIVTSQYYAAKGRDEKFVIFPGDENSLPFTFTPEKHKKETRVIPRPNTTEFLWMLKPDTNPSFMSGGRWELDKGRVYYFVDACDATLSTEVGVASRRIVQDLAASLFSNLITQGKNPPKDADIVTVQRDVVYGDKTAILEFTIWKLK